MLYHYNLNNFWIIRHERNHDIYFCSKVRLIISQWDIDDDTYVELSFQADLPFHQKLIQFRSVRFLIRQIIHKIWIDRKSFNLYLLAYTLLMRLLSTIQCLGTLFANYLLFYKYQRWNWINHISQTTFSPAKKPLVKVCNIHYWRQGAVGVTVVVYMVPHGRFYFFC